MTFENFKHSFCVPLFLFLSASLHTHFLNGTCTGTLTSTAGGTTITVTEVFLNETGKTCFNCGAAWGSVDEIGSIRQFRRCARCKIADYCSDKCQRSHWNAKHKKECPVKPVLRMSATGAYTTTDLLTPVSEESVNLPLPAGIVNTLLSPSFPQKDKPLSINRSSPQDPESQLLPILPTQPQVSKCPPTHLPPIQIVRSPSLSLRNSSVPQNTESKRLYKYQIPHLNAYVCKTASNH